MNGLDLLLNYSLFSEHMHQLALACLLRDAAVTRALGLLGTPRESQIETHDRLFDISVLMEDAATVHVELKLDSLIRREQLEQQREKIEGSGDQMLYILLGGSQFVMSGDDIVATWTGGSTRTIDVTSDGVVLGPLVPTYLSTPKVVQLRDLVAALAKARSEISNDAVGELADAYVQCLESIQSTFKEWQRTAISEWKTAHWIGFFDYLRASVAPDVRVLNRFGQPGLSWGYRDLHILRIAADDFLEYGIYLDAKGGKLCVKLHAIFDADHVEYTQGVRDTLDRELRTAARKMGVELVSSGKHVAGNMTVACVAGSYLAADDSGLLDWNRVVTTLGRLDQALDSAVKACRAQMGGAV